MFFFVIFKHAYRLWCFWLHLSKLIKLILKCVFKVLNFFVSFFFPLMHLTMTRLSSASKVSHRICPLSWTAFIWLVNILQGFCSNISRIFLISAPDNLLLEEPLFMLTKESMEDSSPAFFYVVLFSFRMWMGGCDRGWCFEGGGKEPGISSSSLKEKKYFLLQMSMQDD